MAFKDKYTNPIEQEEKKIILSNDAYAIGELLEQLIKIMVESTRANL